MLIICPDCQKVLYYNSNFGAYLCDCGYDSARTAEKVEGSNE